MTTTYTPPTEFIHMSDPGHGWLLVTPQDLAAVGLTEANISGYSYRRGNVIGLEEDCDADTFFIAYRKKFGRDLTTTHRDGSCRSWASFGTCADPSGFWAALAAQDAQRTA